MHRGPNPGFAPLRGSSTKSSARSARNPGGTLAIHLCRGNNRSGGYDAIAEKLFGALDVDRFVLEYDDKRSGTFEPLRHVPKSKIVVLGIVSTKKPELENPDDLVEKIYEAAKYFPLERRTLSPQCGFASTAEGNLLTEDEQWAKLKLVADTAQRFWAVRRPPFTHECKIRVMDIGTGSRGNFGK